MDFPSRARPSDSSTWHSQPAGRLCLVLASFVLIALAVGKGAEVVALGRWMGRVCGEWAPPGWRNDPRCDGSVLVLKRRAYTVAKWSGGGLSLAFGWLIVSRKRARATRPK